MTMFPFYKQFDKMDCGPTCLRMIAKFYGKRISLNRLRELSYITKEGVSLMGISHAAEKIGLKSLGTKVDLPTLVSKVPLPCIIPWEGNHFVVLYKTNKTHVFIANPERGKVRKSYKELQQFWAGKNSENVALIFETTPKFYNQEEQENEVSFSYFFKYFYPHKNLLIQIFFATVFSSVTSLLVPFITQSMVDIGILGQNIKFVYLVLLAQLMLTFGQTAISLLQAWISLHLSIRISLSFVIGYITKLMKMPFTFFELKTVGDIINRIEDNSRIEEFINKSLFSAVVSIFNLLIYGIILAYYNYKILLVFIIGNFLYTGWVLLFLKKRREFDHERFKIATDSENKILQLFYGAREILLNNIEKEKRWEWERVQSRDYKLNKKVLLWEQFQTSGATIISSSLTVVISLITALSVIDGSMSLGMMMSVQFILGQIQAPIKSFINLTHSYQDAKISLERLSEVIDSKDDDIDKITSLPISNSLRLDNVSFQYEGPFSPKVLNNINLEIPFNKTTAIVGASGSGKTTLLKLLLKLYSPTDGSIFVGKTNLKNVSDYHWRELCGTVMQDNYIFSDSIINNIALKTYTTLDSNLLFESVNNAQIKTWIESLPKQYKTKIGTDGYGLSQGQKQRILIARALYKNPEFIFLDEATNSLDTENEASIIQNLSKTTKNKTVIVIAHRLSTIKHADSIVVLRDGKIVEQGNHLELLEKKGNYYELINNQL